MKRNLTRAVFALTAIIAATPLLAGSNDRLLSVVPVDAATVGLIRIDDVRSSPLGSRIFDDMDRAGADGELAVFLSEAGLDPDRDVDAMVFATTPRGLSGEADVLVAAQGRFAPERLAKAIVARGAVSRSANGVTYYMPPAEDGDARKAAVYFAANDLVIAGTENAVTRAIGDLRAGGTAFRSASPLAMEMHRIDPVAAGWLLVDVQRSARLTDARPEVPENAPFNAAALAKNLKKVSTVAVWAREDSEAVLFGATAVSSDLETRELLGDLLRGATAAWRMAAQEKSPELVHVIRRFRVSDGSDSVTITGSLPASVIRKATAKQATR